MANTIIRIRSSGVTGNVPSSLQPGELAINYVDGKLFYGDSLSQTAEYSPITEPAGLDGELQFNNLGSFGSDASLSFNDTSKTLSVTNLEVGGINVKPQLIEIQNHANAAFDLANTLSGGTSTDGWARNAANSAGSYANSAYVQANTSTILAQAAFDKANTGVSTSTDEFARGHANAAYTQANTATTDAATADQRAVTSGSYANSAYIHANAAFAAANSGSSSTDTFARNQANSAYNQANTGTVLAQSAYDYANTLALSGGSTIGITNDTTTNSEYYITFTDSTSGVVSSLSTSSPKLGYTPSTGTLKVESIDVTANATISSKAVENTTGTQFVVDSFSVDEIRSAFYQVQIESLDGFEVLNLNIVHDDSNVSLVSFGSSSNKLDYGELENSLNTSTNTALGQFTATIVGNVLNLLFTPSVSYAVVSFIKNTIRKIAQFFPTGDLGYVADSPSVYYDLGYVGDSSTSSVDYGGLS